jgi:hypothetical protein
LHWLSSETISFVIDINEKLCYADPESSVRHVCCRCSPPYHIIPSRSGNIQLAANLDLVVFE